MHSPIVHILQYGSNGKPDWFRKLNPKGEVPVLVVDGTAVVDSEATLDYLAQTAPRLAAPAEHAAAVAAFRSLVNSSVKPVGKRAVLGRSSSDKAELTAVLHTVDAAIAGPYVCGELFTVADASAFPLLWRLHDEFGFPKECTKLSEWLSACKARPSVSCTIQSAWWWWW
jgi:glutathione S-transferase